MIQLKALFSNHENIILLCLPNLANRPFSPLGKAGAERPADFSAVKIVLSVGL